MELIVEMVESLLPSTRVAIMRLESDRLYHSAGSNVPDSLLPDASGAKINSECGTCMHAASHDEEIVAEDIATDPHWEGLRRWRLKTALVGSGARRERRCAWDVRHVVAGTEIPGSSR